MNRKKGLRIFAIILIVLAFLLEGIYHFKLEPADRDGRTNDTVAEEQNKEKTTEEEPVGSSEKKQEKQTESQEEKDNQQSQEKQPLSKENATVQTDQQAVQAEKEPQQETVTCTISIDCKTIADKSKVTNGAILDYIPSNGILLSQTTVTVKKGSSVYDVLQKAAGNGGIPVDVDGSYIRGIGHIYEFDAGELSGWMYQVNGVSPNYGCSSYEVKEGDVIRWCYTCDLGKDVGGSNY